MPPSSTAVTIREADLGSTDASAVSHLVDAYLQQTEREKAFHLEGRAVDGPVVLESSYQAEVDAPQVSYADAAVHLAEVDAMSAGVVVLRRTAGLTEVKRLWAAPEFRGRGIGSALIDTALQTGGGVVRLSVWQWRTDAIRLYASRGFRRVPSWDARPALVCLEHRR